MSASDPDPIIGQLVAGRYRVLKPLGEGGMGQVYLALHEAIEKQVALKILRPEYSRKEDIVTRFQQEAISASRIKHPNVLDVFDFGKLDTGEAFLAMEFLEGHDLSDDLQKHTVLEPARGIHIALQICKALAAAHSRGVVHRDMKPDNVFLQRTADGDEIVKIVDFGIAQLRTTEEAAKTETTRRRLTKTGMIFGTPEYMAPEQAAGKKADLRVDIYAVGVILYEMFTGAVPFTGDSFMAVLTATLHDPPKPMNEINPQITISPEFQSVIMRALAKSPESRYSSMTELANAIGATPEGSVFGRLSQVMEVRASNFPHAPGAETAAQFAAMMKAASSHPPSAVGAVTAGSGAVAAGTAAMGTPQGAGSTTQLGGQAATMPPTTAPSLGLVLGSIGFVVVAGAIGAFVLFTKTSGSEPVDAPPAATAAPQAGPEPTAPPPPASAEAKVVPAVNTETNEVKLHVETDPPGAMISKNGFQVCEESPCDVMVDKKEGVTFEAQKGTMKGEAKILAQQDQTVSIKLVAPVVNRPRPPAQPRMCEVDVNGLKILRPCQ